MSDEIEELRRKLDDHEKRIAKLESSHITGTAKTEKKTSLREFIISNKPGNDVEKTLAIGYYLEKCENEPFFNASDIRLGFKNAKEKIPSNVPDKIFKNVKKGHMMKYGEKKDNKETYVLTNTGEAYLENEFKDD